MTEPSLPAYLLIIAVLLSLSAFFSAAETAFISLSNYHFKKLMGKDRRARRLRFWFTSPNKVLISTLVGNNLVNIAASVLTATMSYRVFHHEVSISLTTGILTFVIIVFGEIIPKSLAKRYAERIALTVAPLVEGFCIVLTPVTWVLLRFSNLALRVVGARTESILPILTEDDLKAIISAGEEEGLIEEEERDMIHGIFELGETAVSEIMVPRVAIVAVEEGASLRDALAAVVKDGFSRMPVYRENLDVITGIVYVKDILARLAQDPAADRLPVSSVMRTPYYVPETTHLQDLLAELRERKLQMAIVVDEYGGTAGLATMEDLLEEIVGEIADEYKKEIADIQRFPDGSVAVRGTMEIEKANEELGLEIPEGEGETVAGFILEQFGRIPERGEHFIHRGRQFAIQEADRTAVRWVRIRKTQEPPEETHEPGRDSQAEE